MNNQDILYKDLPAKYGAYVVSSMGEVISNKTKKPVAQSTTHNGYKFVKLHSPTGRITKRVSRLVAEMFVPNPLDKPQVDHIDNDKTNNRADNLQWLTASENVQKSWDSGRVHYTGTRGNSGKIQAYYISNENIERLKTAPNKSQLINELLEKHFENTPLEKYTAPEAPEEVPYMKPGGTPPGYTVEDLIKSDANASTPTPKYDPVVAERQLSGEQPCCSNDVRPCKHWVWDVATGEGYVNTLSGRSRDAE